jgi:hypothetical protein
VVPNADHTHDKIYSRIANKKRTTFVGTCTATFAEKLSIHCEKQNKNSRVFSIDIFPSRLNLTFERVCAIVAIAIAAIVGYVYVGI